MRAVFLVLLFLCACYEDRKLYFCDPGPCPEDPSPDAGAQALDSEAE